MQEKGNKKKEFNWMNQTCNWPKNIQAGQEVVTSQRLLRGLTNR